jgi:hypothetical protein
MAITAELIERCVDDNARRKQDQAEYKVRYQGLVDRFEMAKARHGELTEQIQDRKVRRRAAECFQREICERVCLRDTQQFTNVNEHEHSSCSNSRKRKAPLAQFDEQFWYATADFITVYHDGRVAFTFKDGTEVEG